MTAESELRTDDRIRVWLNQTQALLAQIESRQLPARVVQFVQQLHEYDEALSASLINRVQQQLAANATDWRQSLRNAFPEHDPERLDVVVLLRGLLESLAEASAPAPSWPALRLLAHELIPQQELAVELIRDPKQPAEWFSAIEEADVPAAEATRPGWALRSAHRPWFCFPPAKKKLPRPNRRSAVTEAAEQMRSLAMANDWLAAVEAPAHALVEIAASGSSDGADSAAGSFLDAVVQAIADTHHGTDAAVSFRKLPKPHAAVLEQMLGHARRWCGHFGLEILPRGWSFLQPLEHGELQSDERSCAYLFRPDEKRGSVYRVRTFGLKQGDRALRECAVSVSAGAAPAGLAELEEVIKVAADHGEEVLLERLRGWREAAFQSTLDLVIVQFFVDFWGELGEELRQQHPDLARDFSMRLFDVLKLEFKLYPFYPVAYQEHPDGWLQRVSGRSMVSGRVRRILRPGLQDENGQLRVPALVDVE